MDLENKYLLCREYDGHPLSDKLNRVSFFKYANKFYFVIYKEDGTVKLRSEGFSNYETRDNHLSEVLRFINGEDNYNVVCNGELCIRILKDDKGREIGRSCLENNSIARGLTQRVHLIETLFDSDLDFRALDKENKYLNCKYYFGHPLSDKQNKVAFFRHQGRYFFVIYYADGRVRLRSEGFEDSKGREADLKEALCYLDDKDQYAVIRDGDLQVRILLNKERKEVGRTCPEKLTK